MAVADDMIEISLNRAPSLSAMLVGALFSRRPARVPNGELSPRIKATLSGVSANASRLKKYRDVCGFGSSPNLPITYPHVLAMPVQLAVLTHTAFPVRLPGLIHVENEIIQRRPIPDDARFDIACEIGPQHDTEKGQRFDLVTVIDQQGERVWEEVTSFVSPSRGIREKGQRRQQIAHEFRDRPDRISGRWDVPANTGRRYASASGDYNPIHLSKFSAKRFGFDKPIIHGMWSLARSIAALESLRSMENARIRIRFRKPIPMPVSVELKTAQTEISTVFSLCEAGHRRPYLEGFVESIG